jgi:hypothetical protein
MTTFVPRAPYSEEELQKLYPKDLELQLVQVLLRHGERSPVSARFQNVCHENRASELLLTMVRPVSPRIGHTAMLPGV